VHDEKLARVRVKRQGKKVTAGAVNSEVTITLSGGAEIVSIITKGFRDPAGPQERQAGLRVIKSSDVMIATD